MNEITGSDNAHRLLCRPERRDPVQAEATHARACTSHPRQLLCRSSQGRDRAGVLGYPRRDWPSDRLFGQIANPAAPVLKTIGSLASNYARHGIDAVQKSPDLGARRATGCTATPKEFSFDCLISPSECPHCQGKRSWQCSRSRDDQDANAVCAASHLAQES